MKCTIPYSLHLNGKAKRINRTIMEKARAMIVDSNLGKNMWGEAVLTAAYLTNCFETLETTLAEIWHGVRPNLKNLNFFGSKAFAKELGYLKKLDDRSNKYIMVEYIINEYRLWDDKKKRIIF